MVSLRPSQALHPYLW